MRPRDDLLTHEHTHLCALQLGHALMDGLVVRHARQPLGRLIDLGLERAVGLQTLLLQPLLGLLAQLVACCSVQMQPLDRALLLLPWRQSGFGVARSVAEGFTPRTEREPRECHGARPRGRRTVGLGLLSRGHGRLVGVRLERALLEALHLALEPQLLALRKRMRSGLSKILDPLGHDRGGDAGWPQRGLELAPTALSVFIIDVVGFSEPWIALFRILQDRDGLHFLLLDLFFTVGIWSLHGVGTRQAGGGLLRAIGWLFVLVRAR